MKKHSLTLKATGVIFLCLLLLSSCKKDKDQEPTPPQGPSGTTELSDADSLKLLMYNTMEVSYVSGGRDKSYDLPTYYWYNQVNGVDPLSSTYPDANSLLSYMKTFAKQPNGNPYDRYSFLDDGTITNETQNGVAGDMGMQIAPAYDANNNIVWVVLYADKNSPAGEKGVRRGMLITTVNGQPASYDGPNGTATNNMVNAVYNDPQASFTFQRSDGTSFSATLAKTEYQLNPVLFDTVYNINGKNVGYFVFYTFSSITDDNGASTITKSELDRVFNEFSAKNITDIIVDLRYNGGGAGNTAEYLDSLIAPANVAGKVMYQYIYNDKLTAMESQIGLSDKVLFSGGGNLNLQHVFFIGTGNTASASELVLNNLKPYMNVQLVGDTTYGKPFGFLPFPISIYKNGVKEHLADLYAINMEVRNANNQGGYYNGIVPDELATDYVGIPWGSPDDDNLQRIFSYISTGTYGRRMPSVERMRQNPELKLPVQKTIAHPLRINGLVSERVNKILQNFYQQK